MERDLVLDFDRDLERLRDLEADFVDLDITAASPPQTVTRKRCTTNVRKQTIHTLKKKKLYKEIGYSVTFSRHWLHRMDINHLSE